MPCSAISGSLAYSASLVGPIGLKRISSACWSMHLRRKWRSREPRSTSKGRLFRAWTCAAQCNSASRRADSERKKHRHLSSTSTPTEPRWVSNSPTGRQWRAHEAHRLRRCPAQGRHQGRQKALSQVQGMQDRVRATQCNAVLVLDRAWRHCCATGPGEEEGTGSARAAQADPAATARSQALALLGKTRREGLQYLYPRARQR